MDIMKITENVCNPDTGEGEWITRYDLVEEGPRLLVRRPVHDGFPLLWPKSEE